MKMKKILCVLLATAIIATLCACAGKGDNLPQDTTAQSADSSTTQRVTSTTAPAKSDAEKGGELKLAVIDALGNQQGAEATGDFEHGSFVYKYIRDAQTIYANERSDEIQSIFKENAIAFSEQIKAFYNDDIIFESIDAQAIGSGENGIDSVIYYAYFTNTQNQLLEIRGNSDGEIYYVACSFTW